MSKTNERDTWESEKWVIDSFVEAVESGEAELRDRLAQRLLDGYRDRGWTRRHLRGSGLILMPDRLNPEGVPIEELLEELEQLEISEKRIAAISAGSPLRRTEVEAWRSLVIERAFDGEFAYELGQGNVCVVLEVKHSNRRRGVLGRKKLGW